MNTVFSLTNQEFLLLAGGVTVAIAMMIYLFRRYYGTLSATGRLSDTHNAARNTGAGDVQKKYPEVDVFRWSSMFFRISLVAVLVITIGAFNLTTYERSGHIPNGALDLGDMDIEVEVPRSAEATPPPPPPPPPVIQEVPNETILTEDQTFVDNSPEDAPTYEPPKALQSKPEVKVAPPPITKEAEPEVEEIFKVVEEMPRFPGCENLATTDERKACADKKMLQFIYDNIQYPSIARENGIEGTVVVRFVVEADGAIKHAEVVRDIGGRCGEEAMRVVSLMNAMPQKWSPGRQRGKPVRVWFNLPVKFILEYN